MMLVRRMRRPVWLASLAVMIPALLALLAGCSEVLNEYYVSNHTQSEVMVRFSPYYTDTYHAKTVDILAGSLGEEMGARSRGLPTDTADYELVDGAVQFRLGPRRTVFLGISSGGNEPFSHIEIALDDRTLSIDEADQREAFRVIDNFIGAVVHVLDVRRDMKGLE